MSLSGQQKDALNHVRRPSLATPLTALETEIIDLFVQVSHLFGQPRSLAECQKRKSARSSQECL